MDKFEIMIKTNKYNEVIYIGGFNEKILSNNIFYLDISQEDFDKYANMMPNLYYENDSFIQKSDEDLIIINKNKIQKKYETLLELKVNLQNTDYKIIKCYEAFMRQQPLPYNLEELSAQRDAWRAEINQLEEELKKYEV
jgi:hypothetical protein